MKHKKNHLLPVLLLASFIVILFTPKGYARINGPDLSLRQEGFDFFRSIKDYAFANPVFVAGAGTNLLADGNYYNLIESDYYKKNKEAALLSAYEEYQSDYQNWINIPNNAPTDEIKEQTLNRMVFNKEGIFKAFQDDYANPAKVVYLTVIASTSQAAKAIEKKAGVTLIYASEKAPCVVIRLQGNETLFNSIIDDPDVLLVAPAFGESINPYHSISILSLGGAVEKTPADARDILRYSVGLSIEYEAEPVWAIDTFSRRAKTSEKWFFICSDLDFDGHISSEDARIALRISVGLEQPPMLDTDI